MDLAAEWRSRLSAEADSYARLALENITREYPTLVSALMTGPGQFPRQPRDRTPVFYGSYDWHSCVEMHWVLVRLLKTAPGAVPAAEIRAALDAQFTPGKLRAEAEYAKLAGTGSRHYAWGWALALVHEASALAEAGAGTRGGDDPDARRWSVALATLADAVTERFIDWLPKATYPIRYGLHPNTAFALSRSLPHARDRAAAGDPGLAEAIEAAATGWYAGDADYPAAWEPSGADFLSPALTEAELMALLLPADTFAAWLGAFLPGIARGEPATLFEPAVVSDPSDGQIAHLHGLNASRAWCWRRIAESLDAADPRVEPALASARRHAAAALPHVVGDHYNVEHWLAAYAVLLLT